MDIRETILPGVYTVQPKRFGDDRGYFSETFRLDVFGPRFPGVAFVQDNMSFSAQTGTVRGLHFQRPPFAQGKLVSCLRGSILDAAVDIRKGSPTFGQSVAVELNEENGLQLWVPAGFAHAFCTLRPDTIVCYKVTNPYAPDCDAGILWHDETLGIAWPVTTDTATVSAKDQVLPRLADIDSPFTF